MARSILSSAKYGAYLALGLYLLLMLWASLAAGLPSAALIDSGAASGQSPVLHAEAGRRP
ncbi:hypothetical protein EDF83_2682 [Pseudomonas protegens]|uniref:hypothetical protein n=1 Tax=Pseudomonas TaxID=286 RepID=UPI000908363B|nr:MULTISPECIES: hypothetical protein [Pseudomonas]APC21371.1 hypothetical protein BME99_17120 [Pseudomonas protegens]MBB1612655.1 hypothetical protein [Pseudomonas sp. UMC65]MBB1622903.1 hypothetical protein [Pseudomonas sp. UME65]MBF0643230.1 hypothetical protein [Pseudomonas protegens]MCS4258943.1 hypothetical protein [Pseudomonas sp. BIGb0176]